MALRLKKRKQGHKSYKLIIKSSTSVLDKFNKITQAENSVIVQASTRKISLCSYLYLMKAEELRNSLCDEKSQSLKNIFSYSPEFQEPIVSFKRYNVEQI